MRTHENIMENQLTMNSFTRISQNGSCAMERIDYYTYQGISGLPCSIELNPSTQHWIYKLQFAGKKLHALIIR